MKSQLIGNLKNPIIKDLENRVLFLKKQIEDIDSEYEVMQKIGVKQEKALDVAAKALGYPEKVAFLKFEINKLKDQFREQSYKQQVDEKNLKARHEIFVDVKEKCRLLREMVIRVKKFEETEEPLDPEAEKMEIEALEARLKETEEKTRVDEHALKQKIKDFENIVRESRHTLDLLQIKLKEKDQESRISMLKVRELRRAVAHTKSLNKLGFKNEIFEDKIKTQILLNDRSRRSSNQPLRYSEPLSEDSKAERQHEIERSRHSLNQGSETDNLNPHKQKSSQARKENSKAKWEKTDISGGKNQSNVTDLMSSIDIHSSSEEDSMENYQPEVNSDKLSQLVKPKFDIRG